MREEFNYDTKTTIIGAKQHLQNSKIVHTIIVVETLSAFVALLFGKCTQFGLRMG